MRACVQRVSEASVTVDGSVTGRIGRGLVVLLGVGSGDGEAEVNWLAEKIVGLRVFEDDEGKMNRSLAEVGGAMLVVSQFTLYGDCRRGRRPSFIEAAPPELAEQVVRGVRGAGASGGRRSRHGCVSRAHAGVAGERRAGDAVDRYGGEVAGSGETIGCSWTVRSRGTPAAHCGNGDVGRWAVSKLPLVGGAWPVRIMVRRLPVCGGG